MVVEKQKADRGNASAFAEEICGKWHLKPGDQFYPAVQGGLSTGPFEDEATRSWKYKEDSVSERAKLLGASVGITLAGGGTRIKLEPTQHAFLTALLLKEQTAWKKWADSRRDR